MRNIDSYKPTKFRVDSKGRLRASTNRIELGIASRLIAELVAGCYSDALSEYARGRLIDLGCGKVPLYIGYSKYVDEVMCVDWASSLSANEHIDAIQDLTQPLNFPAESFDTVIMSDVLEHIATPDHLMLEIGRILREGGKLIMNVPFLYGLHEMPHDYHRYTESALRRLVVNSGLKVIVLKPVGGSIEVLTDFLAKHVVHIPAIGPLFASLLQGITYAFSGTKMGRRAAESSAKHFPLGYFLVASK